MQKCMRQTDGRVVQGPGTLIQRKGYPEELHSLATNQAGGNAAVSARRAYLAYELRPSFAVKRIASSRPS